MIVFALESRFQAKVQGCETFPEALNLLLDDPAIGLIVCDDSPTNVNLFKYLASVSSKIPFVLIGESGVGSIKIFPDLELLGTADSSDPIPSLYLLIEEALAKGQIQREVQPDVSYCRINTELLVRVIPLKADIYIRLSNIKYVKLFQEGDIFNAADLQKYLIQKKISYLYLKKEGCGEFVRKFSQDLSNQIDHTETTQESAEKISFSVHEVVHELSSRLGFTAEVQQLAKENIRMTVKSIGSNPRFSEILNRLNRDPDKYISSHSMMLAHVACCMATEMKWPSDTTFQKLTSAALCHDVVLNNHKLAAIKSLKELEEKKVQFTEKECEEFKKHPIAASGMIKRFSEMPADVDVIILQHHERPDGTGFPRKLTAARIAPLACLFIIAHDLVDYVFDKGGCYNIAEFIEHYKDMYNVGNFKKIVQALKTVEI